MIIRTALLALLAAASFQVAAGEIPPTTSHIDEATSLLAISPIFSQLVAFKMPLAFHVVNEETAAHSYIREAVLKGETAEQWTEMITVTGYKDVAADPAPPPAALINTLAEGFRKTCPETVTVGDLGSVPIDGYPAGLAFLACGSATEDGKSHSEAALVLVVKGTQDYYTIQWAERGLAQASRLAFDDHHWVARLKQLMPVFLCDRVSGENAPYSSCVSRLATGDKPGSAVEKENSARAASTSTQ